MYGLDGTTDTVGLAKEPTNKELADQSCLPGIAPESTQGFASRRAGGQNVLGTGRRRCSTVPRLTVLAWWLSKPWLWSDTPMKPPAQDPNFLSPKARVYQPELWGLFVSVLFRKPGLSEMCVALYWTVLIISVESACSSYFSFEGRKEIWYNLSSWFVWCFFSHTVGCHQSHHTACNFLAGPEPRRWLPAGTSPQPGLDT